MLNTTIFYDNSKYFTEGYYIWTLWGACANINTDDESVTTVTSENLSENSFLTGENRLIYLGAISSAIKYTNATIKYTNSSSGEIDPTTAKIEDTSYTGMTMKFPEASSGVFVNQATTSSGYGIGGIDNSSKGYAALYWIKADDTTGSNIVKLLGDGNGVATVENLNTAKSSWNYKTSAGGIANNYSEIGENVDVFDFATIMGERGTYFELIYDTTFNIDNTSTSILNSYNYTGFTIGSLTVTLA